jgi:hypothetical protein
MATMDEYIDQLLAEMPEPSPLRAVLQNILDEPIPEAVKKRLLRPLLPSRNRPSAPPRRSKERKRKAILEVFDPLHKQGAEMPDPVPVPEAQQQSIDLDTQAPPR